MEGFLDPGLHTEGVFHLSCTGIWAHKRTWPFLALTFPGHNLLLTLRQLQGGPSEDPKERAGQRMGG